jgi:hypothetical protein
LKISVYVGTHYVGSEVEDEIEIPDEELEGKNEQEQDDLIDEYAREWMFNNIDWGWEIADGSDDEDDPAD